MTESLRDKLICCGWVTNFNADTLVQLIERHYAPLAQPEPQGPTNAQVDELAAEYLDGDRASVRDFARAVLARWWGNSIIAPDGPAVPSREPDSVANQPTDKELLELMPETMRDEFAAASDVYSTATGGQVAPGLFRTVLNTVALEYARAVLQRYGRPAIEPVAPVWADIQYVWELLDAEGEWQASGSANSLDDVRREGNRCLQTYAQDGPHKLIIQRHCVNTIEEVTND